MKDADSSPAGVSSLLCIVWVDGSQARIAYFGIVPIDVRMIHAKPDGPKLEHGDPLQARLVPMFMEISLAVESESRILLLGPGMAKYHLRTFWYEQRPGIGRSVIGFETLETFDTDQLAARARLYRV